MSLENTRDARGFVPLWGVWAVLGLLTVAVYPFVSQLSKNVLYDGAALMVVVAAVLGVRLYRAEGKLAWTLISLAFLAYAVGDITYSVNEYVFGEVSQPFPSLADYLYIAFYPLAASGLVLMIRTRAPGRDTTSLTDASIVVVGAAVLGWLFFMEPYASDPSLSLVEKVFSLAYPVGDLLVLAMAVRLSVGGGEKKASFYLLIAGIGFLLLTDTVYAGQILSGTYVSGSLLDCGWLLAYFLVGVAALHPSMVSLTSAPSGGTDDLGGGISRRRMALLAGAILLAPGALLIQDALGHDVDALVIFGGTTLTFGLVLLRMRGLVADLYRRRGEEQLRAVERRFQTFVEKVPVVIYLDNLDDINSNVYTSPQSTDLTGYTPEEWMEKPDLFMQIIHPDDRKRILGESYISNTTGESSENEYRILHKDGHVVWLRDESVILLDGDGRPEYRHGVLMDITDRKVLEQELQHRAYHDSLTGLPNRAFLTRRIATALDKSGFSGKRIGILFIDLDDFKLINDSLGHGAGDRLLEVVARRISGVLNPDDIVARLGGDEFCVLIEGVREGELTATARRIMDSLEAPVDLDLQTVTVSASIGMVVSSPESRPEDILRDADVAMYEAKSSGKAAYRVFDPEARDGALKRLRLEEELRRAVKESQFVLHYQPTVAIPDSGPEYLTGFEALVRWNHPTLGLLPPDDFIPIAESTGLVVPLGAWVMREACRQFRVWQDEFSTNLPLSISVNVSPRQFRDPKFCEQVERIVRESGIEPGNLFVEVTESAVLVEEDATMRAIEELKSIGVKMAIDDFGTGYSSLGYLKKFPVDVIKIDRSFVSEIHRDDTDLSIVSAMISFANSLGVGITAEGIDNPEQLTRLRDLGCRMGQGSTSPGHYRRKRCTTYSARTDRSRSRSE